LRRLITYLTLILSVSMVTGQNLPDTVHIEEVHVYGLKRISDIGITRSGPDSLAMISSITAQLSDLLSAYSPVFVKSYGIGSVATASFRGTAASHTQLVWNGLSLNSPMRGSADLSLLPVMFIDNAYLLHGASSLSETSGSLGGSIHLTNNADWSKKNSLVGIAERGSYSTGRYIARIQTGSGSFRSVTRIMADQSDNTFPFYNVGVLPYRSDTLKNAGYKKMAALQEFYLLLGSKATAAGRVWVQESNRNLPPLMSFEGGSREENQKDDQFRVQVEFKKFNVKTGIHVTSGINKTTLHYFRRAPELNFINDDSFSRERSWYNRLKITFQPEPDLQFSGTAEINHHSVQAENSVRNVDYSKNRLEAGTMVHVQYKPFSHAGFFGLLRSEWYDNRLIPVIPSAGFEITVPATIPLSVKGNAARNFHKPSLNDLYWLPGGNPDLKPEEGVTADIALAAESRRKGVWTQELTGFYSVIDNWIIWQPSAAGAWYWEAANIRKVKSRGIEYHFRGRIPVRQSTIQFSGNYAFTRTTNENAVNSVDLSRGRQLIYIPKHTGNLHAALLAGAWSLRGELSYTGRRYTQSSNEWTHFENVLNPFWLTGVSLERKFDYRIADITARFNVHNLLGVNHQQILWRPMPGRHYTLMLGLAWNQL
jgi:outer membrane cobalamin receptor